MRIVSTPLAGVALIEPTLHRDDRGWFSRLYGPDEFASLGIDFTPCQTSISHNAARSTLRGMHFSSEPETKLVRCIRGRIFDVVVDIRPGSPTFRRWHGLELDPDTARALLVPAGVAHGYLTLEDDSDVLYLINRSHRPAQDRGLRWNDPAFGIDWPCPPKIIHPRDATYPDYLIA